MSWNSPKNYQEAIDSTRSGFGWRMERCGLAADSVLVLSAWRIGETLDREHPLSDHVATGAERYRDDFMAGGPNARKPHPSVTVYYLFDLATRRVVLAGQADGTILDELDVLRPNISQEKRDALREAFKVGVARVTEHRERGL